MKLLVFIRGGGDLASGVAARLYRCGYSVVISELNEPLAIRRSVAFSQAIFDEEIIVEDICARRSATAEQAVELLSDGIIPVIADPDAELRSVLSPAVLVDARMTKKAPDLDRSAAPLVIGLGPGFEAGIDCHAVVETKRGHFLGRVYWEGAAEPNTGSPGVIVGRTDDRVLRAPKAGEFKTLRNIGDFVEKGDSLAHVNNNFIHAPFKGLLRGLLQEGLYVDKGMKVGDVDPRLDERLSKFISEKALAIGGGVLEAILVNGQNKDLE
jgi:xanthine dehydrogenase accessory factor